MGCAELLLHRAWRGTARPWANYANRPCAGWRSTTGTRGMCVATVPRHQRIITGLALSPTHLTTPTCPAAHLPTRLPPRHAVAARGAPGAAQAQHRAGLQQRHRRPASQPGGLHAAAGAGAAGARVGVRMSVVGGCVDVRAAAAAGMGCRTVGLEALRGSCRREPQPLQWPAGRRQQGWAVGEGLAPAGRVAGAGWGLGVVEDWAGGRRCHGTAVLPSLSVLDSDAAMAVHDYLTN